MRADGVCAPTRERILIRLTIPPQLSGILEQRQAERIAYTTRHRGGEAAMKARRPHPGRTDVRLPRTIRRNRSATALLLSFALLCTSVSLGAPARRGLAGPRVALHAGRSSAVADKGGAPSVSDVSAPSLGRLAREPRVPHQRIRPARPVAAVDQESASAARELAALPAAYPVLRSAPSRSRDADEPPDRFLAHASKTSRTRGQPVSGC